MPNVPAALAPSIVERLARARGDLRMGVPVVLTGDGRAFLVVAVEALEPARLAALRALGQPELALTARRAETLKTPTWAWTGCAPWPTPPMTCAFR
jgi:GTP cyclohydrolase II